MEDANLDGEIRRPGQGVERRVRAMTKPNSIDAEKQSEQFEGGSAAVRARTNTVIDKDTTKSDTTGSVEDDATEATDTESKDAGNSKRRVSLSRVRRRSRDADGGQGESDKEASGTPTAAAGDDDDDPDSTISDDAEAGPQEGPEDGEAAEGPEPAKAERRISWSRVLAYGVLPGLALSLAGGVAYLKWVDSSARASDLARIESVAAAKDSTIMLLSYKSDTVEKDLEAAKSRLTGKFKDSYAQLINDVVIPGAKKGHVSTTTAVPAAASVSASPDHAVTLLFVNQTAVVDKEPPSNSASSVRVTLDKVEGRWLISGFDPV
jgi:Mce-associated membrane protein